MEVGTSTTDAPWTKSQGPLACPPFKAPRPAKRPRLDVKEEDVEDLSIEVPEPRDSADEPAESVTIATESSQLP